MQFNAVRASKFGLNVADAPERPPFTERSEPVR